MNVDQSRISRFENGDVTPTPTEVAAFLKAVGTPEAQEYADYLNQGWRHLPRPEFGHPEISALGRAESCLQGLEELLLKDPSNSVRAQAEMHVDALRRVAAYLMRRDHRIAFIGEIGVGKSAAISVLFNLLVPAKGNEPALERTLLPLGTGRVTLCEEEIATEPGNFAIVIDPEPQEEVLRVVSDVCADAWRRTHDSADESPSNRVTWEIERAIRNMSELGKPPRKATQVIPDPLDQLARNSSSPDLLRTEVFSRLNLWRRTRTRLETPSHDGAEVWLRDTLKDLNYGKIEDVGLPRRIKVIVSFVLLPNLPYSVSVIDTKGIEKDDYAVRPDLMECVDDDRTIIVLCSGFNSLPDIPSQQLLKHVLETRAERVDRCVLLGLAKFGEALNTPTDSGDRVEDKQEAYELKTELARRELRKMNLKSIT